MRDADHRRGELEHLMATVFSDLVAAGAATTDAAIESALARVGAFAGADRAYVFLFRAGSDFVDNTHEWCADGVEPQKDNLQALPVDTIHWWVDHLRARETIHIPVVADLPPAADEVKRILESQGIQSLIVLPMAAGDELLGFLGFDAVRMPRVWTTAEHDLLRLLGVTVLHAVKRKQAEEALRQRESYLSSIIENQPGLMWLKDAESRFLAVNRAFAASCGVEHPELLTGKTDLAVWPLELAERYLADDAAVMAEGVARVVEEPILHHGELRWFETFKAPVHGQQGEAIGTTGYARDITERRHAREEREKLRSQLAQAQKMESVGRLAGGVAHDFNNMLTVILGQVELALKQVTRENPLYARLLAIRAAAERSADLTRQLLAFARKQTVSPRVLDLNQVVESTLRMLRRLIGEDIDLAWLPGRNLGNVRIDPSQVDQILANLCVNARDAIKDAGKVTIETEAVTLDETYCATHAGFAPGEFILLAVSDNGCGMDRETLSRLFEPFFTTKEHGKGTGLGLATVYGIVKQNNGFVNVYSEPGGGTTVRVYLPRVEAACTQHEAGNGSAVSPIPRGSETVLVVEDEPAILEITRGMLEHHGYTVLTAGTPAQAMSFAASHPGQIHLAITDVVMPQMNGRELGEKLRELRPGIRQLFMSGYTANVIAHHGVLDEGVHFIQKPFSAAALAAKVSHVLRVEPQE